MTTENQTDPYRTPAEIPGTAKNPPMRSPLAWLLVAGILSAIAIVFAFAHTTSDQNVIEYVEEFGYERRAIPDEIEVYERMMSEAASVSQPNEVTSGNAASAQSSADSVPRP